jgi:deoxyribodipyrimidine photo-lyase
MGASLGVSERPALVWFRDDLRLADNPALTAAARGGRPVVCLYVLDESPERRPLGGAARWWLHHSLAALRDELSARGVPLVLVRGPAETCVPEAVQRFGIAAVHWCRRYGSAERVLDEALRTRLEAEGVEVGSHPGRLLVEPWEVRTRTGDWFKVFTPFWKAAQAVLGDGRPLLPVPNLQPADTAERGLPLDALELLPTKPDWAAGLRETWVPGEASARERLGSFLDSRIDRYASHRDVPAGEATSELSAHLRFGEISASTVHATAGHRRDSAAGVSEAVTKFHSELGWREFAYHLLWHFPDLATRNFQPRFDDFPWRSGDDAEADAEAWRRGRTGYPIVDAGMRQLWQTGVLHNRVRLIVASFLVKHLLVDWRVGEAWFWDTLVDADPANNAASWQWVAGSGADAAPYFRIFNPVAQGERFDPDGTYVKRWVPELSGLPSGLIHKPWGAPAEVLAAAGVVLGGAYPSPIVDHDAARRRALSAFEDLQSASPGRHPPRSPAHRPRIA